jgi:NAD(P)-dependent dehydrogenase (short-subunit alcohol dehydrogenase family)
VGRHTARVAVITGAAGGIGQAIACRRAAEGARVANADIAETVDRVRMVHWHETCR